MFAFALLVTSTATAQRTYAEAMQQGDAALRRGAYKTAIDKYFAAEAFAPSKKETVRTKVNAVFDRIEALGREAEVAKRRADKKTLEALAEKPAPTPPPPLPSAPPAAPTPTTSPAKAKSPWNGAIAPPLSASLSLPAAMWTTTTGK